MCVEDSRVVDGAVSKDKTIAGRFNVLFPRIEPNKDVKTPFDYRQFR
jgi:hypothetical protein